jgi:hypothetical protein
MGSQRRRLVLIWLATTAVVAVVAVLAYRALVGSSHLAGRSAPETLLENPEALFEDPGLIGTAVEMTVHRAISDCMAARGFEYRGPAVAEGLDAVLDPAVDGYGIAAGAGDGQVAVGAGGAAPGERDAYEQALYGTSLDGGGTGGCAAVGAAELQQAMQTIENLPYSIEDLERNALSHPAMVSGLAEWSACMREAGYSYDTPTEILTDLAERLSTAGPDEARRLAQEERAIAVADFACRDRHLAAAEAEVAAALTPGFVEANRPQLESLLPPPPAETGSSPVPTDLGSGDIQVTLLWSGTADLDLAVTDTSGFSINHGNRFSEATGGQLDRDANRSCSRSPEAVENIYWPEGEAPRGEYSVRVTTWSTCSDDLPIEFTVVVQLDGRVVINERVSSDGSTWTAEFRY